MFNPYWMTAAMTAGLIVLAIGLRQQHRDVGVVEERNPIDRQAAARVDGHVAVHCRVREITTRPRAHVPVDRDRTKRAGTGRVPSRRPGRGEHDKHDDESANRSE